MCGRFTLFVVGVELAEVMGLDPSVDLAPRYNIAPGQDVLAVRADAAGQREAVHLHWGLIPHWAKDRKIAYKLINARGETAHEKPSFRSAFKRRRCLIPTNGFYEWQGKGKHKQPYFIRMKDGNPFAFAVLWEVWQSEKSEPVQSCTIVTTEPNALVKPIHRRMPVILRPDEYERWLTAGPDDLEALRALLVPYPAEAMETLAVSTLVNNPSVDDPRCIVPNSLF